MLLLEASQKGYEKRQRRIALQFAPMQNMHDTCACTAKMVPPNEGGGEKPREGNAKQQARATLAAHHETVLLHWAEVLRTRFIVESDRSAKLAELAGLLVSFTHTNI